ncbi:GTP-binding protein [Bradyrhizobium sp. I1.7.5]|uniref:GTP-binding protein n=1 Tax=Bradyrhizobium sp. I1.7.5 TaxID=3156363 RepID=UPI003390A0F1
MRQSLTRLTKTAERIKGVIVTSDEADNRYLVQVAGGEVQLTPANPLAAYHKSVLLFVPSGAKETIEAALSKHARWTSTRYVPDCFARFVVITKSLSIRAVRTEPMHLNPCALIAICRRLVR